MAGLDDLREWSLPDLLEHSRALAAELASRVADPGLLDVVGRFASQPDADRSGEWGLYAHADAPDTSGQEVTTEVGDGPDADGGSSEAPSDGDRPDFSAGSNPAPAGSLPVIQLQVEELARLADATRTALAGHVDRVFDAHATRREVLGIPEGKCAYRNSVEYLCGHLRIKRAEAKRRVGRAVHVMAQRSLDKTHDVPPAMPALAELVHGAQADASVVDMVADTLTAAKRDAVLAGSSAPLVDRLLADGERVLAAQSKDADPEMVKKACAYWRQRFDALANPDGQEPTEAQTNARQGLFYHGRGPANLHQWSVLATDAQHEILKTIVSTASNPRKKPTAAPPASEQASEPTSEPSREPTSEPNVAAAGTASGTDPGLCSWPGHLEEIEALDSRSRAQRELDGLVSALTGALALTTPDTGSSGASQPDVGGGGARPQVLVVIDYQTLAGQVAEAASTGHLISSASYAGPVDPRAIRQLACAADLIPVVLGDKGEVLDVGRSQRLFTRKLRRAITARDGGCAAPACSIPAPWCEAHHIEHWENGGPTSVDNGVLLCSHHHHAVHAGTWEISVQDGVPWFIPARYHDPDQRPRRNRYWRPGELDEAA